MGVGDGVNPVILVSSDGSVGIKNAGAIDLTVAGGGMVTAGAFQRLPTPRTTQANVPVPFWSVNFTLASAGTVWILLAVSVICTPIAPPPIFLGAEFSLNVDGVALPDVSFFELDSAAAVNTISGAPPLQSAVALAAGPHVVNFFWQTFGAAPGDLQLDVAAGEANVHIGRL